MYIYICLLYIDIYVCYIYICVCYIYIYICLLMYVDVSCNVAMYQNIYIYIPTDVT